jgi:DNA-directed RNA polymerase I, II, and III subunit RPABC2
MSLALEEENPDLAEELSEIDSLASDNEDYENTSDDEFVPPPPPPEESLEKDETDDEYNEDNNSLASESSDIQVDNAQETPVYLNNESEDEDDDYDNDDDDDDNYLQKFEHLNKKDLISSFHPELVTHNNDEVETLTRITRNEQGIIIDPLHRTLPFLTKYEKARILGERAKQINQGAKPLIEVGPDIIDGYLIALREFEEKKIPFILKRPMPNGGCEYWKFKDLEII